jgi:dienelactone hydrolase
MTRSKRLFFSAAAVFAVAAAVVVPAPGAARPAESPPGFTLPAPTGKFAVGTLSQRLVDTSRADPFAAGKRRELMVQLWYPATRATGRPTARYLPARSARVIERSVGISTPVLDGAVHARAGAPAASGRHPVVLFSPGFGVSRAFYTVLVEDLASRGFVVVAIDHPYDAQVVEFPDGRLVPARLKPGPKAFSLRIADTRFVLDRLPRLNTHGSLAGKLDLKRIGMFGHSVGGAVAAELVADRRVKAGVNLDGSFFGSAATNGIHDPFMVMTSGTVRDPSHRAFRARLRRSQLELTLRRSDHFTFTDFVVLGGPLEELVPGLRKKLLVGSIEPERAVTIQRNYLAAFFSAHLVGTPESLLVRSSTAYPEVAVRRGTRP